VRIETVPPPSPALEIRFPIPPSDPDLTDRLAACLDDYQPVAIDEGAYAPDAADAPPARWLVHFADPRARDDAAAAVGRAFAANGLVLAALEVPDGAWAERSQAALPAVRVGDLVVAPPWDVPDAPAASVVVITPSTGFGTGHHATTRLCLRALQSLDLAGRLVLDLGTGSGVLAIAAVKRGAARAIGVDCDPDALASARHNVAQNGVGDRVELRLADLAGLAAADREPAGVVLANLTASVLERHADAIRRLAAPGGTLVLSGLMSDQANAVVAAFEADGVGRLVSREEEDEWVVLTLRND